jgi:hypothetical protein
MTLAVGAAPLAFDWCQIACADAVSAQAMGHSCHHQHAGTAKQRIAGAPHACGHDETLPATDIAAASINAPAVIVQAVAFAAPVLRSSNAIVATTPSVPISPPTRSAQLRV